MVFWPGGCIHGRAYCNLNISILCIFTTDSTFISQGRARLTLSVSLYCSNIIHRLVPASPFSFSGVRGQRLFGQRVFPSGSVVCLLFPHTARSCHCCGKRPLLLQVCLFLALHGVSAACELAPELLLREDTFF